MPVDSEAQPRVEVSSRSAELRQGETRRVVYARLDQEIKKRGSAVDNPTNDRDGILGVYRTLSTGSPQADLREDQRLPLPDIKFRDRVFQQGEIQIAGFYGANEDNDLVCSFVDRDGNIIMNDAGDGTLQEPLQREVVIDAQLVAEKDTIKGVFSGDSEKLFDKYTTSLPQNETPVPLDAASDALIDIAAREADMLRRSDIDAIMDSLSQTERDGYRDQLAEFDDQVLVSSDDLKDIFRGAVVEAVLETQDDTLQKRIDEISAKIISPGPDDDVTALQTELDNINLQLDSVRRASKALEDAAVAKAEQEPWTQPASAEFAAKDEMAFDVIDIRIKRLESDLNNEVIKGKEAIKAKDLLTQLYLAQEAKGKDYGPMLRYAALTKIQGESSGAQAILTENDTYINEAKAAAQRFDILLKENGITDENIRDNVLQKLQTADGITQLAEDPKFAAIAPKFIEGTFGRADAEIYDLLDAAAIAHQGVIDSTLVGKLKDMLTKDPARKAGILAAFLLALAAAPFVIGGGAALMAVGEVGKGMSR
jgi:hypothetical protein